MVMLRDGMSFLVAWELMSLSSFLLVLFNAEDKHILKTGINYLIQMHIGLLFLIVGFILIQKETGEMSFDALPLYFSKASGTVNFELLTSTF